MLGQHRLEKNSGGCLDQSGEIPRPRQTSTDKTNDCIMNSERGALVRVPDPPQGHRVHTMAGDMRQALTRLMIQTQSGAEVQKADVIFFRSVSKARILVFNFGRNKSVGRRRQALAPKTLNTPDIFKAVINTRRSCPTPSGLAVGCVHVEIEGLSPYELIFISVLTSCKRDKTQIVPPAAVSKKKKRKNKPGIFSPFFPTAVAVR